MPLTEDEVLTAFQRSSYVGSKKPQCYVDMYCVVVLDATPLRTEFWTAACMLSSGTIARPRSRHIVCENPSPFRFLPHLGCDTDNLPAKIESDDPFYTCELRIDVLPIGQSTTQATLSQKWVLKTCLALTNKTHSVPILKLRARQ
ncbi:hypothetical protein KC327_g22 [Hortaea werneckii]|nr:hypothetical protein KC327_g22 [Hortaea werneckii]